MAKDKYEKRRKLITRFGVGLTLFWFTGAALYAWKTGPRVQEFLWSDLNLVGDFLAGFFAPLAFGWLVIGYFLQGIELQMQREELSLARAETKKLVAQATVQAEGIKANEAHARRDAFSKLYQLVMRELGDLTYRMCSHLLQGVPTHLKEQHRDGNVSTYADRITLMIRDSFKGDVAKFLTHSKILTPLCVQYVNTFWMLLEEAKVFDENGRMLNLISESPYGTLYLQLIKEISPRVPPMS